MRVLIVTDFLSALGGTEYHTTLLARALHRCGIDVRVLVAEAITEPTWTRMLDLAGVGYSSLGIDADHPRELARALGAELSGWKPSLIHCHPIGGAFRTIAEIIGDEIPVIGTEASSASPSCPWYSPDMFPLLNRLAAIVATCDRVAVGVRDYFGYRGRVDVIPYFIEPPARSARVSLGEAARPRFGYIGRLTLEKGIPYLLAAFLCVRSHVPGAELRLYGAGDREIVRLCAQPLGILDAVRFCGSFAPSTIDAVAEDCDVFLSASLFEGLPISFLEVLARARPVVSFDVGGAGDLLTPPLNETVPTGDCHALGEAALRALATRRAEARLRLADYIRQQYSEDVFVPRLLSLYESVV